MPRVRRSARTRARLALVACVMWLVGVEALPAFHEALHDRLAPHTHVGSSIVVASFEDSTHRHPDGTIHFVAPHAHPPARKLPSDGRDHALPPFDGHQADGLAHHAAAIAPAAAPITKPLPVDRRPILVAEVADQVVVALDPLAAVARGPPALALVS